MSQRPRKINDSDRLQPCAAKPTALQIRLHVDGSLSVWRRIELKILPAKPLFDSRSDTFSCHLTLERLFGIIEPMKTQSPSDTIEKLAQLGDTTRFEPA